jgi:pyridoxine kinase
MFAVLERTRAAGTEEMRIVASAEQLVSPKRRFEAVAVGD